MSKSRMAAKAAAQAAAAPPEESQPQAKEHKGSILDPRWWFKSRNKGESSPQVLAPGQGMQERVAAVEKVEEPVAVSAGPVATSGGPIDADEVVGLDGLSSGSPAGKPLSVNVDREKQQISLRLSYNTAMISGIAMVVVIGIAVLIGKSMVRVPAPAIANNNTSQIRQSPANPSVLNVPRGNDGQASRPPATGSGTGAAPGGVETPPRTGQGTFNEVRPPATFFTDDPKRINGLNYVIVQSYPTRDMADKVAEFLTKNGIPCTVEKDLPNWPLPWPDASVVVGTRGFNKIRNVPAVDAYMKAITDLSTKFATGGRNRYISAFAPTLYQWRKSN